jgi:large subunit ribosomal protein L30
VKDTKTIRIQWVRSGIGFSRRQKERVRSLGLRRLNQVVELPDHPSVRGLVASISHLVQVVDRKAESGWAAIPEYTIRASEAAPAKPPEEAGQRSAATEAVEGSPTPS